MALVEHVVVDSSAFLRNAPIKDIAKNVYTVHDVVSEIRDKGTRDRLQVLPYELVFVEPDADCLRIVTEFTKKTGDYPSLSATDIKLLALAYSLERKHVGSDHLKTVPNRKIEFTTARGALEKATDIAGFYLDTVPRVDPSPSPTDPTSPTHPTSPADPTSATDSVTNSMAHLSVDQKPEIENKGPRIISSDDSGITQNNMVTGGSDNVRFLADGDSLSSAALLAVDDGVSEEEEEDEEDTDGWITPANLQTMNQKMSGSLDGQKARCVVGCLTMDFAMQNVLIQLGLNVISVDGLLIKKARSYILRCFSCFKISTSMTRQFCHHCGNQTLQKVAMEVKEDGSIQYFLSKRPLKKKRSQVPLGRPMGGKHSVTPLLTEDQRIPQQRSARLRGQVHYGVFDADYAANSSPFGLRDTVSRSAQLGFGKDFNKRHQSEGARRRRK